MHKPYLVCILLYDTYCKVQYMYLAMALLEAMEFRSRLSIKKESLGIPQFDIYLPSYIRCEPIEERYELRIVRQPHGNSSHALCSHHGHQICVCSFEAFFMRIFHIMGFYDLTER